MSIVVNPLPSTPVSRFMSRVDKSSECWVWTGYRSRTGYGYAYHGRKMGLAHRAAWELERGPIPPGLFVCHRCDNPGCVRVDHLFLGTQTDNVRDCVSKGRHRPPRGSRNGGTRLREDQVEVIRMLHDGGASPLGLAESFGVSMEIIHNIVCGRTWRHVC